MLREEEAPAKMVYIHPFRNPFSGIDGKFNSDTLREEDVNEIQ